MVVIDEALKLNPPPNNTPINNNLRGNAGSMDERNIIDREFREACQDRYLPTPVA
jgi:hypothetical protein